VLIFVRNKSYDRKSSLCESHREGMLLRLPGEAYVKTLLELSVKATGEAPPGCSVKDMNE